MPTEPIQPIVCDYENDGTRITAPGKFEGEPVFAPYYWNAGLEGCADNDDGAVFTFKFKSDGDDLKLWPQLKTWLGRKRTLHMSESDQGFVHCY